MPNPALTPGVIDVGATTAQVCQWGYAREHRPANADWRIIRARVFERYGIKERWNDYQVDHLVPLELGGTSDTENLWPQPWPEARRKDKVENSLHEAVCSGNMTLPEAQGIFLSNQWEKYE